MRNRLIDELIADYMGIRGATGRFSAEWFLYFMGLEELPQFREAGRMTNYLGDPPLSDGAFAVLQRMLVKAAEKLEDFDRSVGGSQSVKTQARLMMTPPQRTIEELADERSYPFRRRCRRPAAGYRLLPLSTVVSSFPLRRATTSGCSRYRLVRSPGSAFRS